MFQSVPRRLIYAAFLRRPRAMESYATEAKLPLSPVLLRPAMPLTARLGALKNQSNDEAARADIAGLPGQLARIDGWIEEGIIGGEQPNAADLQIGATVRLLMTIGDVRSLVEDRPASRLETLGDLDMRLELVNDRATIFAAARHLPERARQIIYLRFGEDLTQTEIAARVGVSQMQVSRLLRRSLAHLRELTEERAA